MDAKGASVVVKAVGGGSASILASSEGKSAAAIPVFVTAPCCQVGEGAPSTIIEQAFLDSVTRNRLNLKLPAPTAVRRVGLGYVQEFQDVSGSRLGIALSDRSPVAYVLSGPILVKYESLGGPAGSLAYPASDATAGGRQLFENSAALAGNPVWLVSGPILIKWAFLNYEAGAAGLPSGDPADFSTFTAATGVAQPFQNGVMYSIAGGAQAGKTRFSS